MFRSVCTCILYTIDWSENSESKNFPDIEMVFAFFGIGDHSEHVAAIL